MTYSLSDVQSSTLMPLDIEALQSIYGANKKPSSGNTVYKFSESFSYSFAGYSVGASKASYASLYDSFGRDTIDLRSLKASVTAHLTDKSAFISYSSELTSGLQTSYFDADDSIETIGSGTFLCDGSLIERALGTSFSDELAGGSSDNIFFGYKGDDLLLGAGSNDKLYGGTGKDVIKGGKGADTLVGGDGLDKLYGGLGADIFVATSLFSRDADVIMDFDVESDFVAIDTDIFDASEDDTIEVVSYAQLKSKKDALYDDLGVDVLVVKDTSRNLVKLNTEGYDKAIHLGIVTDKKLLVYDEDGDWRSSKDQVKLMDFTSKFSTLWSGENFLLGYNS